jgi:hypothetical protein
LYAIFRILFEGCATSIAFGICASGFLRSSSVACVFAGDCFAPDRDYPQSYSAYS